MLEVRELLARRDAKIAENPSILDSLLLRPKPE